MNTIHLNYTEFMAVFALVTVAVLGMYWRNKRRLSQIIKNEMDIIHFVAEHPQVENPDHVKLLNRAVFRRSNEEVRYHSYCSMIFKHMEEICEHFGYNEKRILAFCDIQSWLWNHKDCWLSPDFKPGSEEGFSKKFLRFMNHLLEAETTTVSNHHYFSPINEMPVLRLNTVPSH